MSKFTVVLFLLSLSLSSLGAPIPRTLTTLARRDSTYKLEDKFVGEDFLNEDKWVFFNQADPTHGIVNYLNHDDAVAKNLATVSGNVTTLSVDDTSQLSSGQNRNSVRITTKKTYNGGLFISDFAKIPHGCSVWPAYWSTGANWPNQGEIDVIEGVHNSEINQMTLHTGPNCNLDKSTQSQMTGTIVGETCTSSNGNNNGCGVQAAKTPASYGHDWNEAGGGVFAHLWEDTGIKIWNFPRDAIPPDITSGEPNPNNWGTPAAYFGSNACDTKSHFLDHSLIINIAICGDWAGSQGSWEGSGCPESSCAQAVMNPDNFKDAKWVINYVSTYSIQ